MRPVKLEHVVPRTRVKHLNTGLPGIFLVTLNGHTYNLFKNIFNDVQTDDKGGGINHPITNDKLMTKSVTFRVQMIISVKNVIQKDPIDGKNKL